MTASARKDWLRVSTPSPETACSPQSQCGAIEEPTRFVGVCVDHGALVAEVHNLSGNVALLRSEVQAQGSQTRAAVNYASGSVGTLASAVNMLRSDFDRREATRASDSERARWVDGHRKEAERTAWARSKAVRAAVVIAGAAGTVGVWEALGKVLPVVWRALGWGG
jgi:outer membrane murein-binding lipoprotein Lpp